MMKKQMKAGCFLTDLPSGMGRGFTEPSMPFPPGMVGFAAKKDGEMFR
jgi:hypothetical protein